MNNLQDLMDELSKWQNETFPVSNPISKLHHLAKEVDELIKELHWSKQVEEVNIKDIELEYADCFLLLFGSAAKYGLKADDIFRIVREKLEINRKRNWGTPDANGVVTHIKE